MMLFAAIPHIVGFFGAILFGYAILLSVRILSEYDTGRKDTVLQSLRLVGWILIVNGVMAILFVAGFVPGLVALVVLPSIVHRRRRAHRYALLSAIVVAAERKIGLIPVLLAFSTERRGYVSRRAMDLASRLQAGWALPDAVDSVRGLFPEPVRLAIRMGYDSGTLALTLREAIGRNDATDAIEASITGKFVYFMILTAFLTSIVTFIMIKIVPAMQMIFEDFGMELPWVTVLVVSLSHGFVCYWYLLIPPFGLIAMLGVYSTLRFMGVIEADMPGFGWTRRRIHTAAILDTLSMFARAQRPITEAVSALSQWYPAGAIRARLRRSLEGINSGRPWTECLARQRLISPADRGVLEAAQRVGNLPWAMSEMADGNRRRYITRATAIVQTAFVGILLGYGFIVMLLFVGNFLPLIKLISSLS